MSIDEFMRDIAPKMIAMIVGRWIMDFGVRYLLLTSPLLTTGKNL